MTHSSRANSNRSNAQYSTGPKSKHGKAKSSKNAQSHGLSIPIDHVKSLKEQRDKIAQKISTDGGMSELNSFEISTAVIMLQRIREEKVRFLSTMALSDALQNEQSMLRYEKEARARIFRALKAL